jgi:hypothetical protein
VRFFQNANPRELIQSPIIVKNEVWLMSKTTTLMLSIGLALAVTPAAHAWQTFLDGSTLPGPPWEAFSNEGGTNIVDLGGGNFALRMDSPEHSDGTGTHYNEYFDTRFGESEIVGAARFRLTEFSSIGKENLLAVTVGGAMAIAPSITLVDGRYWVRSYTSFEPILDLGPAVANEWHTAYILARNDGTSKVWWDGAFVVDGPVTDAPNFDGYVEFGSGTYWETTAHTVVDFDWVGSGDPADMIPEPRMLHLFALGGIGVMTKGRRRKDDQRQPIPTRTVGFTQTSASGALASPN